MMITESDVLYNFNSTVRLLPLRVRRYFYGTDTSKIREIRLGVGRAVRVVTDEGIKFLSKSSTLSLSEKNVVITNKSDIEDAVEILTSSSVYSCGEEIKNGYITASDGSRVGICGTMTPDGNFMSEITSLNYRFAREIKGAADKVTDTVYNGGNVKNTLIVSKPGCGKTTLLRDLVRQISDRGKIVSVADERGEISSFCGEFDLGKNTDVLSMCAKDKALCMMIRSMSPQVAAVDEIGSHEDIEAIKLACRSGTAVIATMHGGDWKSDVPSEILSCFKCVIQLSDKHGAGWIEQCVDI